MVRIAVLVSGGGTNLQALIDAEARGQIENGIICGVISSKGDAFALERAKKAFIPTYVLSKKEYKDGDTYNKALIELLHQLKVDLVVLAGFMTVLSSEFCREFENRIINVHPSLIPSFCGDGYYGLKVHEAVLEKGAKITGATVHFVNEITDGGAIIAQKAVAVHNNDTPDMLQKRVMREAEHILLPEVISLFCKGKININGNKVTIDKD